MNLKGETVASAVGKYVTVLYNEGGTEDVGYRGVVVHADRNRRVPLPLAPRASPV